MLDRRLISLDKISELLNDTKISLTEDKTSLLIEKKFDGENNFLTTAKTYKHIDQETGNQYIFTVADEQVQIEEVTP